MNPKFYWLDPGSPFWTHKDERAWGIPKGEYEENENPLEAAMREFQEEIGQPPPTDNIIELGDIKIKSGKIIKAWAIEGNLDVSIIHSNFISIEWPPHSGKIIQIPEVDKADWFSETIRGIRRQRRCKNKQPQRLRQSMKTYSKSG